MKWKKESGRGITIDERGVFVWECDQGSKIQKSPTRRGETIKIGKSKKHRTSEIEGREKINQKGTLGGRR